MAKKTTAKKRRVAVSNRRRWGWFGVLLRAFLVLGLTGAVLGGLVGVGGYLWYARDLPELKPYNEMTATGVTRFRAADGQLVGEWYVERRLALRWEQMPKRLILAYLAAEDARFFAHDGVDLRGIVRTVWTNFRAGSIQGGGSTITQQVAKTLVGNAQSYERKAREAILARRMEDIYTKEQILTWYMNVGYLGHGSYGVQAAAQNYFRKDVWNLTLAECAMIAGLPQSPSRVNPVKRPEAARKRMAHVLKNMVRRGWIEEADRDAAMVEAETEMQVYPLRDRLGDHTPQYTERARRLVAKRYGPPEGETGSWLDRELKVSLAVEPGLQRTATEALGAALEGLAKKQGFPGALGQMDEAAFFAAQRAWLPAGHPPERGARHLARVQSATKKGATVVLGPGIKGTLALKQTSWAGRYTDLPKAKRGRAAGKTRVSFKPRLKDMRKALTVGDIVLVQVGLGAPESLSLTLVPVPLLEGAILSAPRHGGGADVMVGSWDFDRSQVHRADATRQTGSTMKPIIYSKAYDLGLPPSALFSGAPFREGSYNPTGSKTKEDMLVWRALAKSENSVSLRVLQYVLNHTTKDDYRAWGEALGLPRPLQGNTSEVLGGDQTPVGMLQAFGTFASGGLAPEVGMIRKVVDRDGHILERHIAPADPHAGVADAFSALVMRVTHPPERRIDRTTAHLIARNLEQVVLIGTATRAKKALDHPAAGKTGTLPYDVWFDGFSPWRTTVAWVGSDRRSRPLGQSERNNKVYGSDTALPAWLGFMGAIDQGRNDAPALAGPIPANITTVAIDRATGLRADGGGISIPHREGTEPKERAADARDAQTITEIETEF